MNEDPSIPQEERRDIKVLLSTCPPAKAEELAGILVERGHAACVNIIPQVTSIYRWEGKIHRDSESLLVIKCTKRSAKLATAALLEEHPYDVPEVIELPVEGGNPKYLEWVMECAGS